MYIQCIYSCLEVIEVYTTIQKWGNSQAVRIPKAALEMVQLKENDAVEIRVQNGVLPNHEKEKELSPAC